MENKIWDALEEPADLTPDEIASIRRQAHSAYLEKMENKQQPRTTQKKSGFLRRVVAVFAIAVGLMVLSMVYTVLAPVTVGNANSFVRRAAIWINDQLHLGISFPVPEEEDSQMEPMTSQAFASLQEAADELDMPIAVFDDASELVFTGIEVLTTLDNSKYLFIRYSIDEKPITIEIEPVNNDFYDINSIGNDKIICPIGEVYIWTAGEENWAILTDSLSRCFFILIVGMKEITFFQIKPAIQHPCMGMRTINGNVGIGKGLIR